MNSKEILDNASNIIRRQDLDRGLLLFFVNTVRRAVLRDKPVKRFYDYRQNLETVNGVLDMSALGIKNARVVEWFRQNDDGTVTKVALTKLISYRQAIELYGSLDAVGDAEAYLELGTTLRILPVPTAGEINVYGEFWPDDLTDSSASTDIMTAEIPEALIYLGVAEYFDMLGEADKAQYWRQKGLTLADGYVAQLNSQDFDGCDVWKRRPFRWHWPEKVSYNSGFTLEDLDLGEWR
ncbi:MAG: hypothetical protein P4N41_16715 [Negativicutes bacterium]|nr:hypothetical protein [Negativicutes bacterium]MDR3591298.1 hypothetical protein [Negativicutes bacterium]